MVGWGTVDKLATGVAVVFELTGGKAVRSSKPHTTGPLPRLLMEAVPGLVRVLALALILQILALIIPLSTKLLLDVIIPQGDTSLLLKLGAGTVAVGGFVWLAFLVRSLTLLNMKARLDSKLATAFVSRLFSLPYLFFQRQRTGDLVARIASISKVRDLLTMNVMSVALDGPLVILYLGLLIVGYWPMAVLAGAFGVARIMIFLISRNRYRSLLANSLEVQASSRSSQIEVLEGVEHLKASGAEGEAIASCLNSFIAELNVNLALGRVETHVGAAMATLDIVAPLSILLAAGGWAVAGEVGVGTAFALSALGLAFLAPLGALVRTLTELLSLGTYLERINGILVAQPEQKGQELRHVMTVDGRIELSDVSFRFSEYSPEVIDGVSLEIAPREFIAIVGSSGAGKTTLGRLLLGLYKATSGAVKIDGAELSTLDLRSLRQHIGIVTQDPHLFPGTLRSNIACGREIGAEDLAWALKLCRLESEVDKWPMGLETRIVNGGSSFAGGERQRIALARAVIGRPRILLLDEATSNLDPVAERAVLRGLSEIDGTKIVIAHRLGAVSRADRILVMERGRVVETGTHKGLLRGGSLYSALFGSQIDSG